jgi:hypothetical protein
LPFPQDALLQSVTCVQLSLITILGNCVCVAVASVLGVPSLALRHVLEPPKQTPYELHISTAQL